MPGQNRLKSLLRHAINRMLRGFLAVKSIGEDILTRDVYLTAAGEPYDCLKRALRAEIDESAWSALYSTVSRPFEKPETGKIAIKVINHYGDEVLKVFGVE